MKTSVGMHIYGSRMPGAPARKFECVADASRAKLRRLTTAAESLKSKTSTAFCSASARNYRPKSARHSLPEFQTTGRRRERESQNLVSWLLRLACRIIEQTGSRNSIDAIQREA